MIITLDGPAGSGKSTLARLLAGQLGYEYIDSGALYRALTLFGLRTFVRIEGHQHEISKQFKEKLGEFQVTFAQHQQTLKLSGEDITEAIRDPKLTSEIKGVANHPDCREVVNQLIRSLAKEADVVVDGRDIGTVVFPESKNKFYLEASAQIRAKRRASEQGTPTRGPEFQALVTEINRRDQSDLSRDIAPLKVPKDATLIQTDLLSVEQVLRVITEALKPEG